MQYSSFDFAIHNSVHWRSVMSFVTFIESQLTMVPNC